MTGLSTSSRPGLQAERTQFAWNRTALAFAVNGILLLSRYQVAGPAYIHYWAAGLAGGLLIFTLIMAVRRRYVLRQKPLPQPVIDAWPLLLVALGAVCLASLLIILLVTAQL